MNSRILKKLCKRAAKYKAAFKYLDQVEASCTDPVQERGYDCKSYERWKGKPNKHYYVTVLKGTISFGSMSGGYEPEWEDSPAYTILKDHYIIENTEYSEEGYTYTGMKKIYPSELFKHYGI